LHKVLYTSSDKKTIRLVVNLSKEGLTKSLKINKIYNHRKNNLG